MFGEQCRVAASGTFCREVWSLSCRWPGRRRPVLFHPPTGTWHSSVAAGETEAQGCVSLLELGVAGHQGGASPEPRKRAGARIYVAASAWRRGVSLLKALCVPWSSPSGLEDGETATETRGAFLSPEPHWAGWLLGQDGLHLPLPCPLPHLQLGRGCAGNAAISLRVALARSRLALAAPSIRAGLMHEGACRCRVLRGVPPTSPG